MNLVTGLIITGVVEHAREDNWTWQQRLVEEAPFIKAIHDFAEQKLPDIWIDGSSITSESLEVLLSDPGLVFNIFSFHRGSGRLCVGFQAVRCRNGRGAVDLEIAMKP